MQLRSKAGSSRGFARLMLMLCAIAQASGQTAPAFRSNPQIQLPDATSGAAETSPPGGERRDLFNGVPPFRPQVKGLPVPPRTGQTLPGAARNNALPNVPIRVEGASVPGRRPAASARSPETPVFLQRHAARNLAAQDDSPAFTLRSTGNADVLMQLSIGLQSDTWHTDNVSNSQRRVAVQDVIMESRPILQFEIGTPPVDRTADESGTEYYLRLQYIPTLHVLLEEGTSRTLQRVMAELGRVSPKLTSILRFEYDENIFGALGNNSVEESSTVTEVSPFIAYNLSIKTALHAEATWRRIAPQDSSTQRSEYIVEAGIVSEMTAKTTLGAGLEFGHIAFDQAQFGAQDYQQAYASMIWQASRTVRFQTRAGVELREFDTPAPKPARVSPVATAILNWSPNENSQVSTGLLVRNQPSVSRRGATYQEVRIGMDARRRITDNLYIRGEASLTRRAYDTGVRETEAVVRPAFGFHARESRLFDSVNFEIYYQFKRLDSNGASSDRDRNIFGIESTFYF